jgi:type IV pilus assembly protein PilO
MASFKEMPFKVQALVVVGAVLLLSIGAYFLVYKSIDDQNTVDRQAVAAKKAENENLRQYEPKLQDMNRQIEALRQQLEIEKKIVPDEKEADQFMKLMQEMAVSAGIEIRRYTAKPTMTREYFTEAPFEIEIDGPYYSVLDFFEKVGKMERIVNVSGLKMASVENGGAAGARKRYAYAPGETVVATCVATAFFSRSTAAPVPVAQKR